MSCVDDELTTAVRTHAAAVVSSLARWCGDLDVAEESVADAVAAAVVEWRSRGVPERAGAWLHTVARRRALDRIRRMRRMRDRLPMLESVPSEPRPYEHGDDRLALLFACCHPALERRSQLALTLRAVIGLTSAEIARALITTESAVTRRITRAKHKIVANAIPLVVPPAERMPARLDHVLTVLYLAYNEGHLATAGVTGERRDLAEDAIWLARLVASQLPDEPEAVGLLALLVLSHSRAAARFDGDGGLVRLADQDRSGWDGEAIAEGIALVERAAAMRRPGRFQVQAAIAAVHAEARTYDVTDWEQIVALYGLLRGHDDSPVVRLNGAVALAHVAGSERALAEVEQLAAVLDDYHLFHAVRAHLLRAEGRLVEARIADRRALELTTNIAERAVIEARLDDL